MNFYVLKGKSFLGRNIFQLLKENHIPQVQKDL